MAPLLLLCLQNPLCVPKEQILWLNLQNPRILAPLPPSCSEPPRLFSWNSAGATSLAGLPVSTPAPQSHLCTTARWVLLKHKSDHMDLLSSAQNPPVAPQTPRRERLGPCSDPQGYAPPFTSQPPFLFPFVYHLPPHQPLCWHSNKPDSPCPKAFAPAVLTACNTLSQISP